MSYQIIYLSLDSLVVIPPEGGIHSYSIGFQSFILIRLDPCRSSPRRRSGPDDNIKFGDEAVGESVFG